MTTLKEYTQLIDDQSSRAWPEDVPGPTLSKSLFAKLLEEAGELAGACASFWGRSLRPEKLGTREAITEEVGDVLVVALRIASIHRVDPDEAITKSLNKFETRLSNKVLNELTEEAEKLGLY